MDGTMRERIADGVIRAWHAFDDMKGSENDFRASLVDAALSAMCPPTAEMIGAYHELVRKQLARARDLGDGTEVYPLAADVWQAMIDAARTPAKES